MDSAPNKRQLCGGSQVAVEKMLQFGKELQAMSQQLKRQYGKNEYNKHALQVSVVTVSHTGQLWIQ